MKKITEQEARKIFENKGTFYMSHSPSGYIGGIGAGLEIVDGNSQFLQNEGFDSIVKGFITHYCESNLHHKLSFYKETAADTKRRTKHDS